MYQQRLDIDPGSAGRCTRGLRRRDRRQIQWTGSVIKYCDGSVWQTVSSTGAGSTLNGITAATGNQAGIANAAYTIVWNWDTLAGGSALKLASTSTAAASNAQKMLEIALSGANGTSAQTTYGAYISNTHAGTTSTNVGLYATASGGTTANYAAIFAAGNVGIGTATPGGMLDVEGTGDVILNPTGVIRTNDYIEDVGGNSSINFYNGGNFGVVLFGRYVKLLSNGSNTKLFEGGFNQATTIDGYWTGASAYSVLLQSTNGGNVGIGNIAPNTTLDVTGFIEWSGQSRVSSTFSKTSSTALAAITGLSATLVAGKTYAFDINLYTTSGASGGIKVDLNGGTATATAIIGDAISYDAAAVKTQTRIAALNTSLCAVTAVTVANCHITGTITVNAAGTFIPEFAQNASNATASTVAIGSTMILQQIN